MGGCEAEIVASTHIMAFLLGALDSGGEWRIEDVKITELKDHERKFMSNFSKVASTGSLVCAMGAINHYSINHTTGQGRLQGFALKVTRALDVEYPKEQTAAVKEKRDRTVRMMYAAVHPVSKRNMAYTLDPKVPNLKAAWVPGVPRPSRGQADEFLKVRTGGIPAGARKLYVTVEACKKIASNGLLVAMPGVSTSAGRYGIFHPGIRY